MPSFNTQPPEGGWGCGVESVCRGSGFNTQPPEGGWVSRNDAARSSEMFQHTAARRRLANLPSVVLTAKAVSTHSRPKAAGGIPCGRGIFDGRFNTQPPEGGWARMRDRKFCDVRFQHTAARRRLVYSTNIVPVKTCFNTQPPEGGWARVRDRKFCDVRFQHTAARRRLARGQSPGFQICCFNTQPPEGGWDFISQRSSVCRSFNTQPPEGGWYEKG